MNIQNLTFKPQNTYFKNTQQNKLGFGVNFSPITEDEKIAEDVQTLFDVFREASKNPKKEQEMSDYIEKAILRDFFGKKPSGLETECSPSREVGRIFNKMRKDPDYAKDILGQTIRIMKKSDDVKLKESIQIATTAQDYIANPDFKNLKKLQDVFRDNEKQSRKEIKKGLERSALSAFVIATTFYTQQISDPMIRGLIYGVFACDIFHELNSAAKNYTSKTRGSCGEVEETMIEKIKHGASSAQDK